MNTFIFIVLGQIVSLFGNAALRFALPLYLLRQTGSAALYGGRTAASAPASAGPDSAGQSVRHSGALPARGTRLPASATERHPAAARQRSHPTGGYRGRASRSPAGCCSAGAPRHPGSAGALRLLLCTFCRDGALPVHPTGLRCCN